MIRSITAVVAGGTLFALSLAVVDVASVRVVRRVVPGASTAESVVTLNDAARVGWLAWEAVSLAAAAYVASWIAGRSEIRHAVLLGLLQALMTLWALLTVRDASTPLWFWIAGIVLMVPAAWLGGRLRANHVFATKPR